MRMKIVFFGLLLGFSVSALAAPAAWYVWRSRIDGTMVCAQVSPGEGWEQHGGPYKDIRCTVPGVPGQ